MDINKQALHELPTIQLQICDNWLKQLWKGCYKAVWESGLEGDKDS